jgi:Ala-tRNA(Pro) deacylase
MNLFRISLFDIRIFFFMDIYQFLARHNIEYKRYDHPPVFTCEESNCLCPEMPAEAAKTKNLFLRNKKGRQHFLVTVRDTKRVDVRALEPLLGVRKLSFASPQRLQKYLGLTPGSVTILGLINDVDKEVEVIVDEDVWNSKAIRCHPLVNTSTLVISQDDIRRFLEITGHEVQVLCVPSRSHYTNAS